MSGACLPALILSGSEPVQGLAVDAVNIYVLQGTTETIIQSFSVNTLTLTGTPFSQPTPNPTGGTGGLAVNSTGLYWIAGGAILTVPLAGAMTATTIATGQTSPLRIVANNADVYWTCAGTTANSDGTVMMAAVAGGALTTIATAQPSPIGIAIDGTDVYWADTGASALVKAPLAGGAVSTFATGPGPSVDLAVQGANVYFLPGSVESVPVGGGAVANIAPESGGLFIAADSQNVYWLGTGGLAYAPLNGGTATTIWPGPLNSLAMDATSLYFVAGSGSPSWTVFKLAKP